MIFKIKYYPNRSIARFKVKLIAQKFSHVQGINFCKTFATTIKKKSLQIYLAICLALNLIIHQVDIVIAYLKSLLDDNKLSIFMKLPLGIY